MRKKDDNSKNNDSWQPPSGFHPGHFHGAAYDGSYMSEDDFQSTFFRWARNAHPETSGLIWHTPNGGSRNVVEGMKFKALGVVAGVFDLLFFWGGRLYAFELKVGYNEMSDKQIEWGHRMIAQGAICFEARTMARLCELFEWALAGGQGTPPEVHL